MYLCAKSLAKTEAKQAIDISNWNIHLLKASNLKFAKKFLFLKNMITTPSYILPSKRIFSLIKQLKVDYSLLDFTYSHFGLGTNISHEIDALQNYGDRIGHVFDTLRRNHYRIHEKNPNRLRILADIGKINQSLTDAILSYTNQLSVIHQMCKKDSFM